MDVNCPSLLLSQIIISSASLLVRIVIRLNALFYSIRERIIESNEVSILRFINDIIDTHVCLFFIPKGKSFNLRLRKYEESTKIAALTFQIKA